MNNEYFLTLFAKLFLGIFFLCLGIFLTVISFFFQHFPLYYASACLWIISLLYLFREYSRLKWIQNNIQVKDEPEPEITVNLNDELTLKVVKYYANGMSMPRIMKALGFTHPTQVNRALRKGIKQLLAEKEGKLSE